MAGIYGRPVTSGACRSLGVAGRIWLRWPARTGQPMKVEAIVALVERTAPQGALGVDDAGQATPSDRHAMHKLRLSRQVLLQSKIRDAPRRART